MVLFVPPRSAKVLRKLQRKFLQSRTGWIRTNEMQQSKCCALPLGDSPEETAFFRRSDQKALTDRSYQQRLGNREEFSSLFIPLIKIRTDMQKILYLFRYNVESSRGNSSAKEKKKQKRDWTLIHRQKS
jgi:hypothetical protein